MTGGFIQILMPSVITLSGITLLALFSGCSRNYSCDENIKGFVEQFHLNSASVFIGYSAFDSHRTFVFAAILCLILYYIEQESFLNILVRQAKICYIIALLGIVLIHIFCIWLII